MNVQTVQREVPGRWTQFKGATGNPQGPNPRLSPDAAPRDRPIFSNLEAMGDVQGPAVEVLKTELTKARAASKPAVEVEIDQCRKFIARSEKRIRELDTQRAEECVVKTEAQERLEMHRARQASTEDVQPVAKHVLRQKSEYLWEMDNGEVHCIPQGEGGEQGDPMMPLLCSLGQHGALETVNDRLTRGGRLLAFLDDTFIVTPTAAEVGPAYGHVREALRNHSGIHIHVGKTKTWNRAGNRPAICDMLERIAQRVNPRAKVRRGSQVPTADQGMKVLGTSLGHEDNVARHLESVAGATCPVGAHTQGPRRPQRMVAVVALRFSTCKLPAPLSV